MNKENENKEKKATSKKYLLYGLLGLGAVVVVVAAFMIYSSLSGGYVAKVGTEKVNIPEYKFYLNVVKNDMLQVASGGSTANIDPNTFWNTKIDGENALEVAKKRALDMAKESKVQLIKAKEAKIALEKTDLDAIDNNIKTLEQYKGSKTKAEEYIKGTYGITINDLREILKESTLVGKFKKKETEAIKVTDEEVKAYYDKNPDKFKNTSMRINGEEALWARHILINTVDPQTQKDLPADKQDEAKKKAQDLLAKAKNGEDFAKLAKENSEDPGSAQYGGDYVFGKGKMVPEFDAAAFNLNPGQVSDLVKTKFGYHIIKLEEKIAKDQPVSFNCAKQYREFGLSQQTVINLKYQQKVDEWKNAYKMDINQSAYNALK